MAAGKRKKKVETVYLVCEETGDHNYTLRRKTGGEKLKLKTEDATLANLKAVSSVHVKGSVQSSGQSIAMDLTLGTQGCTGDPEGTAAPNGVAVLENGEMRQRSRRGRNGCLRKASR